MSKSAFVNSSEVYQIGDRRFILIGVGVGNLGDHQNKTLDRMMQIADIVINDKTGEVEKNRHGFTTRNGVRSR